MKDTVAIIGSHPRTRTEFDFSREDCDIWLFNEALSNKKETWAKRADAIFQMHEEAIWRNPANRNDSGHAEWLKTQTEALVYMQEQYADVPKSTDYPLEDLSDLLFKNITLYIDGKPRDFKFFTNSVDYALALVAYLHRAHGQYNKVELYGAEMETNTEYQHQRTGVAYWLGYLGGMGLSVDIHSSIFDQPLYGYEGEVTVPYEHFEQRIQELTPQLDEMSAEYKGAFMELQKAFDLFFTSGKKEVEQALFAAAERQRALAQQLGEISGRLQENQKYKNKADTMNEAAGKFVFSRQEFESAAGDTKKAADKSRAEYISLGTQLDIIHKNVKTAAKGSPKRAKLMEIYRQQIHIYLQSANRTSVYIGASKENYDYLYWLDKHVRAAGGEKSEAVLLERIKEDARI